MTSIHHYTIGILATIAAIIFFNTGNGLQWGSCAAMAGFAAFYEICDRTNVCDRLQAYSDSLK